MKLWRIVDGKDAKAGERVRDALRSRRSWRALAALGLAFVVMLSSLPVTAAQDQEPEAEGIVSIQSDWQGSVFGDVGGQDKITADYFNIRENEDGSATLRSGGDRGKLAGGSEGIAYYFKEIEPEDSFELTATAHVDHWGAAHNQVAFGLMLRSNVLYNEHGGSAFTGNYAAAGALDQKMKAFHKRGGALIKTGLDFSSAAAPQTGEQYRISIKKTGSVLVLSVDDEIQLIETTDDYRYAGLFTARNATVTFSQIELKMDNALPEVDLGEWSFSAFGGNTSEDKNPPPILQDDGSLVLSASGGKVAAGDEGMSFVYKTIPAGLNFELEADVFVDAFNQNASIGTPNQKSFGLMLRDEVGADGDTATQTSGYAAVGALDTVMKGFYKQNGTQTKLTPFTGTSAPTEGEAYTLRIRKSGNTVVLSVGEQSEVVVLDSALQGNLYAGLYAARDARVTFASYEIKVDDRRVERLEADASAMKTAYRVGEPLALDGLRVKAIFSDLSDIALERSDYVVTGFDSSLAGAGTITVHYKGATATINVTISEPALTSLHIKYYPARMDYFPGDKLDLQGLVVEGVYDDGYMSKELAGSELAVSVNGHPLTAGELYTLEDAGEAVVELAAVGTPQQKAAFTISVRSAAITGLAIKREPERTVYYVGDTLALEGLVLYAQYSDGSETRLTGVEYDVSGFSSEEPGSMELVFAHKGLTAALPITVKERELTGIQITAYPQTTYETGDSFNAAGLAVSQRYDNGDLEPYDRYRLDLSGFDSSRPGVYPVAVIPEDRDLQPATLQVSVRKPADYEWKTIRFGQSTSSANNKATVLDNGTVQLAALEGGGKVTGDHDGIVYYYTELDAAQDNFELSATISVSAYAKTPHDGQESFGIMARDAIGEPDTSSVFASNVAAIGGYSGGTRLDNGTQLFVRTGVESPDGAGSKGIRAIMLNNERPGPANTHPQRPYRLTLAKTNSGFTGKLNDGREEIWFEPDILGVQNGDVMYVGFYAARLATIEVSDIQLQVSAALSDPPKELPLPAPAEPQLDILSRDKSSERDYELVVRANADGVLTVRQGQQVITRDLPIAAGQRVELASELIAQADSSFSVSFVPDDTQRLTSYERMVRNFTVAMRSYREGSDLFVAPDGKPDGDGTQQRPLDLDTAVEYVLPGQRIVVQEGRYVRSSSLRIDKYNDGREGAPKKLTAATGARPIIDFDKKSEGVVLSGHYWHVTGLDFTRSAGNTKGFTVGGSHNIVENSRFYEHGDTGLQISRTDTEEDDPAYWPSYNLILNSTSFDNRDPSDNNADGFAAKLTSGKGNVFRGCIAHNNIDDGWDLYTKAGTGAIGPVVIENSIAYNNGFLQNGTVGAGDKNGFKLGGEGIHVPHIIRNSIAFGNGAYGFTSNSNPGVIAVDNVAFDNGRGNLSFTTYPAIPTDFKLSGFVSFQKSVKARDQFPASLQSASNYLFDGAKSVNREGVQLTEANFASLQPVLTYERDEEGSIIRGEFLRFLAPGGGGNGSPGADSSNPSGVEAAGIKINADGSVSILAPMKEESGGKLRIVRVTDSELLLAAEKGKTIHLEAGGGYGGTVLEGVTFEFSLPVYLLRQQVAKGVQLLLHAPGVSLVVPAESLYEKTLSEAQRVSLMLNASAGSAAEMPDGLPEGAGKRKLTLNLAAEGGVFNAAQLARPVQILLAYDGGSHTPNERLAVYKLSNAEEGEAEYVSGAYRDDESGQVRFEVQTTGDFILYAATGTFHDVTDAHWAYRAIHELADRGVVQGAPEQSFQPARTLTRADYALLLVRALKLKGAELRSGGVANQGERFSDVASDAYYAEQLELARLHGLILGTAEARFRPDASISRQDMFIMTARALRLADDDVLGMPDVTSTDMARFADWSDIADYALPHVALLNEEGLVKGDSQGRVAPQAFASRAEAAALVHRLLIRLDSRAFSALE